MALDMEHGAKVSGCRAHYRALGRLAIVLILVVYLAASPCSFAGTIPMAFRYDDYGDWTPIEFEAQLAQAFASRDIPVTYAVVPMPIEKGCAHQTREAVLKPLGAKKIAIIAPFVRQGLIEVAQHGYSHQTQRRGPPFSEFRDASAATQRRMIFEGKAILEAAFEEAPVTFVPPWNSYDAATVAALEQLRFRIVSAGESCPDRGGESLKAIPATCSLSQARKAIESMRSAGTTQGAIVVLFHAYDFREVDSKYGVMNLAEFSALLDWIKQQDTVQPVTLAELAEMEGDWSWSHYRRWARTRRWAFVAQGAEGLVYPNQAQLRAVEWRLLTRLVIVPCVVLGGMTTLSFIFGRLFIRRCLCPPWLVALLTALGTLAFVAAAWGFADYARENRRLWPASEIIVASLGGMCLGLWALNVLEGKLGSRPGQNDDCVKARKA